MQWIQEFPVGLRFIAVLIAFAGAWIGTRGVRLFIRGFCRPGDISAPLWIVRGIRGFVVAAGAVAIAAGILWAKTWLIFFGVVFLAEEIYEGRWFGESLVAGIQIVCFKASVRGTHLSGGYEGR